LLSTACARATIALRATRERERERERERTRERERKRERESERERERGGERKRPSRSPPPTNYFAARPSLPAPRSWFACSIHRTFTCSKHPYSSFARPCPCHLAFSCHRHHRLATSLFRPDTSTTTSTRSSTRTPTHPPTRPPTSRAHPSLRRHLQLADTARPPPPHASRVGSLTRLLSSPSAYTAGQD